MNNQVPKSEIQREDTSISNKDYLMKDILNANIQQALVNTDIKDGIQSA